MPDSRLILQLLDNEHAAAAAAKSLQSCPTLCDPIDGSPPGAFWAQTEDPSGCGAASPSQGRWDPDSLRLKFVPPSLLWFYKCFFFFLILLSDSECLLP